MRPRGKGRREGEFKKRVKSGSRVMQGHQGPIKIVEDRKLKCLDDIQWPPINRKYNWHEERCSGKKDVVQQK